MTTKHCVLTEFKYSPGSCAEPTRAFMLANFRKYTIPCVLAQREKAKFDWYVVLAINEEDDHISMQAMELAKSAGAKVSIRKDGSRVEWSSDLCAWLCWPDDDLIPDEIITTMLPFGAAINCGSLACIQDKLLAVKWKRSGLSFTGGILHAPDGFYYADKYDNPFLSYKEPFLSSKTHTSEPLTAANWKPPSYRQGAQIKTKAAWLYPLATKTESCQDMAVFNPADFGIEAVEDTVL